MLRSGLFTLLLFVSANASDALLVGNLEQPVRTGVRSTADYAVIIGIEDYYELPDVPYAERDAQAVHDFLVYTRGIPQERIRLLKGRAQKEQILDAVSKAGAETRPGGTVWIYYAGHGAADPKTGQRVLVGVDAQAEAVSFSARSVAVADLTRAATKGGGSVMLMTDACFTGTARDGNSLIPGKRLAVPVYLVAAPMVTEWVAAGAGQMAGPLDDVQHGAFTYLSLVGLRGAADGEVNGKPDGVVQTDELSLYVTRQMAAMGIHDQTPQLIRTEGSRAMALVVGLPAAVRGAELSIPSSASAPASKPVPIPSSASTRTSKPVPIPSPAPAPASKPVPTFSDKFGTPVAGTTSRAKEVEVATVQTDDQKEWNVGFDLGLPAGVRVEREVNGERVHSAGLRGFANVLVAPTDYMFGIGAFVDFRVNDRRDLEVTLGAGGPSLYGVMVGAAWQLEPPGPLQVNLGLLGVVGSPVGVAPDLTLSFVW